MSIHHKVLEAVRPMRERLNGEQDLHYFLADGPRNHFGESWSMMSEAAREECLCIWHYLDGAADALGTTPFYLYATSTQKVEQTPAPTP